MFVIDSIKELKRSEKLLWFLSAAVITASFLFLENRNILTLAASLIGVSGLIFVAKGNVIGQVMTVIFGILYGVVSIRFHYWGELITYVGMSAPIAFAAVITWVKNPYRRGEVKIRQMRRKDWAVLSALAILVTAVFYFILRFLQTPNLIFSTISVTTSFYAASLVMLRSEFYGIAYGLNDIVLIVLWILAAINDSSYFPMILCFGIFLINDIYGFFNWQKIKRRQLRSKKFDTADLSGI